MLERRLDKTFLRSSADGVVTEIVAEVGEAIGERQGESEMIPGIVTELLPLGPFANVAGRTAIGAHDLNTLRVRIDSVG